MAWKQLLNPDIRNFITAHERDDVRALALKKPPNPTWPYALILDQIKSRQKAKTKIPQWLSRHSDIILPASNILEQASSYATSCYKASLIKAKHFTDLTGGTGVDSAAFLHTATSGIIIEQDEDTAALLAHNLPLLNDTPVQINHKTAENFVKTMQKTDLIYIDPQRRNTNKRGIYKLEECTPDITAFLPALMKKTDHILLKTSPMLDIAATIKALQIVSHVHIIECQGECKEVLYLLDTRTTTTHDDIPITAVSLDNNGEPTKTLTFTRNSEAAADKHYVAPLKYLFEPGPAFQKAGGFNTISQTYNVKKLAKHTHLYTSNTPCPTFPGRQFKVIDILPVHRKALSMKKAHLTIRNFPGSVEDLRKKLKLKDGGDDYIFACTLNDERKILLHTRKN